MTSPDPALRPLLEREDLFRAFMDHSPAVAWMKCEAGRYVDLSRRYEEVVGAVRHVWLGKTDFDVWPEATARQLRESDLRALASGRVVETLEPMTGPGGCPVVWWVHKFPFTDSSGRRFVGGVGVDVTERERGNAELWRKNAELESLAERARRLETLVTLCAWTRRVRMDGRWVPVEEYLRVRLGVQVTHGISAEALDELMREIERSAFDGRLAAEGS